MPVVGNDPRNGSWEREFEKNGRSFLPDCRMPFLERDNYRAPVKFGQKWDIVFCAGPCAQPKMAVAPDCPHVFFICQDCVDLYGAPPDAIQVPGT